MQRELHDVQCTVDDVCNVSIRGMYVQAIKYRERRGECLTQETMMCMPACASVQHGSETHNIEAQTIITCSPTLNMPATDPTQSAL